MYYEIIYETGEHSIAFYENDKEALSAINAHVERAKAGIPGTPESLVRADVDGSDFPVRDQTWPALRVVKVLVYDKHPAEYNESLTVSADEAQARFAAALKDASEDDVVHLGELQAAMAELAFPMVVSAPHESNYKMKETRELKI